MSHAWPAREVPAPGDDRRRDVLLAGGDGRLVLGPDGLSRYGVGIAPRDALPLGSCTASSPTRRGLRGVDEVLARFAEDAAAAGPALAAESAGERLRGELRSLLRLDALRGVEVVLTPSGTDAELIAGWLAAGDRTRRLRNVVVGPQEVGSGTVHACGGRYFDTVAPHAVGRPIGAPLPGDLAAAIDVDTVELRDSDGEMRRPDAIDAEVVARVEAAVARGERVLVHLVAHSKTGVHAPRLGVARALAARFPREVDVLVDAAQGRFSRRGVLDVLRLGFLVLITGSKFYGGPPFSGALLVPRHAWPASRAAGRPPAGFEDFFRRAEWPRDWPEREALPDDPPLGTLARWGAALAEMQAYYACPGDRRLAVLRQFERLGREVIGGAASLDLLTEFEPVESDEEERLLESKTTVFTVRMRRLDTGERLGLDALRRVARWMNADHGDVAPRLAAAVHVGQAVQLGGTAALRLALGGPLIVAVAEDLSLGPTFESRAAWLEARVEEAVAKLDAIAADFERLARVLP
jgi:uncharacterized protein YndB with AHSA1/START domain